MENRCNRYGAHSGPPSFLTPSIHIAPSKMKEKDKGAPLAMQQATAVKVWLM